MILIDSSIWVDHLRRRRPDLTKLLLEGEVLCHPFVIGELACGHLSQRGRVLQELARLPQSPVASHDEAMAFTERHALAGRGIGWVDVHLLAAVVLARARLWTRDKRLASVGGTLGLGFDTVAL